MTATELMEYVKNPTKIQIIQNSETVDVTVRKRPSFTERITQEGYLLALKHVYDRLDINFLAGVDNQTTLNEIKERIKEVEDGNRN